MRYLKSKKGILIEGTAIIIVFLLSTAMVYLLWSSNDGPEELKIGQMLMEVHSAEEIEKEFNFLFEKYGEYSLLKGLKEDVNFGLLKDTECEVLYSLEKEGECYIENLVNIFAKNIAENVSNNFKKDYENSNKLDLGQLKFETKNPEGKLLLYIISNEKIDIGFNSEREMVYNISIDFDISLDFNFRDYEKMVQPLRENLVCLEKPGDINSEGSSIKNCLNAYPQFSNLRKEEGNILLFDYTVDGALFEEELTGPFRLNLDGLKSSF